MLSGLHLICLPAELLSASIAGSPGRGLMCVFSFGALSALRLLFFHKRHDFLDQRLSYAWLERHV